MPFPVFHFLSNGVALLLRKVFKYRHKVVVENLRNSFPDKTPAELKAITKGFYLNLSDILLESIKGFTMSRASIMKRFKFVNPEVIDSYVAEGKSIMIMGTHVANWEWAFIVYNPQIAHQVVVVYKMLSNPHIEKYSHRQRSRLGTICEPMQRTARAMLEYRNTPSAYIMASDQNPSNIQKAHWVDFLNQDTVCQNGTDKLARKMDYPVFFHDNKRVKRGYYEVTFRPLEPNPKASEVGSITTVYMQILEKVIQDNPKDWLWSHKRWKHQKGV